MQKLLFPCLFSLFILLVIGGCATQTGRYQQRHDSAPVRPPSQISMRDAVPVYEPYNPVNSRSYEVFGIRYHPLASGKDYSATGGASWYGQKFHGHLTSNGEIYDMYAMTAAHKTLPLPSYVQVTNLENNKQVIVRVNDRGPFHQSRIIDLSYAAALKLDMKKQGTAQVKVEVIHVSPSGEATSAGRPFHRSRNDSSSSNVVVSAIPKPLTPIELSPAISSPSKTVPDMTQAAEAGIYIQVAALSNEARIKQLARGLQTLFQVPATTPEQNGLFRLRLGPIDSQTRASVLLEELQRSGYSTAFTTTLP